VNRSKNLVGASNSSRRLFSALKAAQGRCLMPQTAAVPRTGDSVPQTGWCFGASVPRTGARAREVVVVGLLVNLVVPHGEHFVDEILTIALRVGLLLLKEVTVRKVVQVTCDATTILQ
jgi:hypothetical protein